MVNISAERIHVELTKTLCSDNPMYVERLVTYGIMTHIMPEFMPNVGLAQNHPYHVYDVDRHTYECLNHVAPTEALRWTLLLHDIGKGYSKSTDDKGIDHFYGHPRISVELGDKILRRLKFDNKTRKRILALIDYHDYRFKDDEGSVRKAMAKMGPDLFMDYIAVQRADILGQAPSKGPERLASLDLKVERYEAILSKGHCVTIKGLAIGGRDLIDGNVVYGKAIGAVLEHLLRLVIGSPELNNPEYLLREARRFVAEQGYNEEK